MNKKHRASGGGRPPLEQPPVVVQVKLLLYPGRDDDLIAFLAAVPARHKAAAVKARLRTGQTATFQIPGLPDDAEIDAGLNELLF
jgi:hypothetical protein